jgi:hypothetical protein
MSTIIFGDIHGSTFWKMAIAENPDCRIVFLGDYLDGKDDMNFQEELANLQDIINFKKANSDNVILLLGNHDLMYIEYEEPLFVDNLPLFQNAYQIDNIVFTHAGIVHKWFVEDFGGSVNRNIAVQLNNPANRRQHNALRQVGDKYTDTVGGIFMAGMRELYEPLQGFVQIVGHNQVTDIKDVTINGGRIIFCDCLWNGRYLRI